MSILVGPEKNSHSRDKSSQKRRQSNKSKEYELLVFGYQCKLFREDAVATEVNKGKQLIPWMGNNDLMIDRYDCRGHLYRVEEFDFSKSKDDIKTLSSEEMDIESILDEERYLDLKKDMDEEAILQEEEEKRNQNLYLTQNVYQTIKFSYANDSKEGQSMSDLKENDEMFKQYCQYYGYDPSDHAIKAYFEGYQKYSDYERPPPPPEPADNSNHQQQQKQPPLRTSEQEPEKFEPPMGIEIPKTIEVPETRKMQSIIEKTALFLSKQSGQMEIVLKTKQSGNPQFAFLDFENYLNPYYKFILGKIREEKYTPIDIKKDDGKDREQNEKKKEKQDENKDNEKSDDSDKSNSEDEDDDEEDLHPLLQAHKRPVQRPKTQTTQIQPKVNSEPTPISVKSPTRTEVGRPSDLKKIYMSLKYKSNPEPESFDQNHAVYPHPRDATINPYLQHPPRHSRISFQDTLQQFNLSPHIHPPPSQYQAQPQEQHHHPPPQLPQQIGTNFLLQQRNMYPPPPPPPSNVPRSVNGPPPLNQTPLNPTLSTHHQGLSTCIQNAGIRQELHQRPSMEPPPQQLQIYGRNVLSKQKLIGPELPPSINPNKGAQDESESFQEDNNLLPPGVDEESMDSGLPPPPPLPLPPKISEVVELAKASINTTSTSAFEPTTIQEKQQIITEKLNPIVNDISTERYRPSQMLSEILKTAIHERKDETDSNDNNYNSSVKWRDNDSPLENDSPLQNESSPGLRRERNRKYSSPRRQIGCNSPERNTEYNSSHRFHEQEHVVPENNFQRDKRISDTGEYKRHSSDQDNDNPPYSTINVSMPSQPDFQMISESLKMLQNINKTNAKDERAIIYTKNESNRQPVAHPSSGRVESLKILQNITKIISRDKNDDNIQYTTSQPVVTVEPSPDLKPVIDRLASYVAKNGDEFEKGVREKNDPRFDFLNPWNIYHSYYTKCKQTLLEEMKEDKEKEEERRKNMKVSFGLKTTGKINVGIVKKKQTSNTASVFNQEDDDHHEKSSNRSTGFKPKAEPADNKRKLQERIEENEKLLKELQEQALIREKEDELDSQQSTKQPALKRPSTTTPQQQAALKRKAQTDKLMKGLSLMDSSADEVMSKLSKKSSSAGDNSRLDPSANQESFFAAINQAFKGT